MRAEALKGNAPFQGTIWAYVSSTIHDCLPQQPVINTVIVFFRFDTTNTSLSTVSFLNYFLISNKL